MERLDIFFTRFFENNYPTEIIDLKTKRATHDDDEFWKLVESRVGEFPMDEILDIIKKEIEEEFKNDTSVLDLAKEMANDKPLMKERFILEAYVYLSKKTTMAVAHN